jgi:hypothetical protein
LHFRSIHLEADAALLVGSLNKGRLRKKTFTAATFPKWNLLNAEPKGALFSKSERLPGLALLGSWRRGPWESSM